MAKVNGEGSGTTLLLGGTRSGKSALAEEMAKKSDGSVVYIATGKGIDDEMLQRIERHRSLRPPHWITIEADGNLPQVIKEGYDRGAGTIIVDCLTIYVSELMTTHNLSEKEIGDHFAELFLDLPDVRLIMVSNEVGMGLVPPYPSGRAYRDVLGRVNQMAAAAADTVMMMVAGIPVAIKGAVRERGVRE